jgi:GNAT superfamily N-acetyltransferase
MVEIRPIRPDDSVEELTELIHSAYAHLKSMGLNYTAVDQSVSTTLERIKAGCCFVATGDGQLIGTIVVEPTSQDISDCPYYARHGVASAHQLAVAPQHQGKGIGSRLMDAAEKWAKDNGFSELALDTAEPAHHLVALYLRRGYKCVDSVQGEGKLYRSVFMAKNLETAA